MNDEANAQVTLGEVLTERQLLGGMLVHSANNYADTLAMWDAGSIPAFVAKMNRTAAVARDGSHALRRPERVQPGVAVHRRRPVEGSRARHDQPGFRVHS